MLLSTDININFIVILLQMMAFDGKAEAAQFCFDKAVVSFLK